MYLFFVVTFRVFFVIFIFSVLSLHSKLLRSCVEAIFLLRVYSARGHHSQYNQEIGKLVSLLDLFSQKNAAYQCLFFPKPLTGVEGQ